jgi:hypothetical protein
MNTGQELELPEQVGPAKSEDSQGQVTKAYGSNMGSGMTQFHLKRKFAIQNMVSKLGMMPVIPITQEAEAVGSLV